MKYNIHKDKKPEDTVKKIKNILKEIGIETTETFTKTDYSEKTSVRIDIKGTNIGTNGKGTCRINALASGYGEFMERLQGQMLFNFLQEEYYEKLCQTNDIQKLSYVIKELKENISDKDLINYFKITYFIRKINYPKYCFFNSQLITDNIFGLIKYKSLKTKKYIYIPAEVKNCLQTSNGFASGNTYEEAFVQGLSEVCERYAQMQIIKNQICMPDIPYEYYSKYDNIINLIKYIEKYGYKISIKDASCGKLPVIMTIFEKNNSFVISAGSHPFMSIAIERTLTEFLQGFNIKENILPVTYEKYQDINAIIINSYIRKIEIEKSEYFKFLFQNKPAYSFNPKIWEFDSSISNKQMAKSLADKVFTIAEDIYIRNYNFLKFPTISFYVPKISTVYNTDSNIEFYKKYYYKTVDCLLNKKFDDITAEDVYYTCELIVLYNKTKFKDGLFGYNSYLIYILSAILLNDKNKIEKSLYFEIKRCITNKENIDIITKFKALNHYFELKYDNISQEKINKIIIKKYGKHILEKIRSLLNDITLEKIISMLRYGFFNYMKQKELYNDELNQILSGAKIKLKEKYIKNPPEQEHFIDFLYE